MIQYHNAADATGKVIGINEVTRENRASMQFFCLGCGTEMEAVLGQKKEHHFRHKDKGECSPETYYHRLAKRVLKHKFDTQPHFLVKHYVENDCSKFPHCEFRERHHWEDCSSIVLKTIDLKEYYDTCEEEVTHKHFRADLMLSHSEYPERNPVFLEVSVTHDCTPEKIASRIRIIEMEVNNERDAYLEIVENQGKLVPEVPIAGPYWNNPPQPSPVRFHNFRKKGSAPHNFSRFSLFREDSGMYHGICKSSAVTCQNADSGHEENACFEVTISEDSILQKQDCSLSALGLSLAHKRGFGVKNCIFCVYYSRRCTILQSTKDTERYYIAYHCSKYKVYEYSHHRIIAPFSNIPYWEWIPNE